MMKAPGQARSGGKAAGWRGRLAGLAVLGFCLAGLAWSPGVLERLRTVQFDAYQRAMPRVRQGSPVVIVDVDDASLRAYGQWPWPRSLLARLVERIAACEPKAMGLDLLFPEPDRTSPEALLAREPDLHDSAARRALAALPPYDRRFAEALRRAPAALGMAGLPAGWTPSPPGPSAPILVRDQATIDAAPLERHAGLLRSLPEIDRAATGHGLLSAVKDADGVVRRMPLVARVNGTLVPSLAAEVLRLAAGVPAIEVLPGADGVGGLRIGPLDIPTEADGTRHVRYAALDRNRYLSAATVLDDTFDPDLLEGRLVLVAVTGLGLADQPATPVARAMPGVEVHAQLLENILEGSELRRPAWMPKAEAALLAVTGLGLIAVMPLYPPRRQAALGLVALVPPLAGIAAFAGGGLLVDGLSVAAGDAAVFVTMLAFALGQADRARRALARTLEDERLAAARVAGEMNAARRIQMSLLPDPATLAGDPRFEVAALIEPALEVGGDLYDCFRLDDRHLFLAVGDVTGKGVPASLVMALAKALTKDAVLRHGTDLAAALTEANAAVARDNAEMLFVTLFAAVVDLDSGEVIYCSAGHAAPLRAAAAGGAEPIPQASGLPLAVMEDYVFTARRLRLAPGDLLIATSDGVGEALNGEEQDFGDARTRAALADLPPGATAGQAMAGLRQAVADFVGGAPPSDDLTILAFRWIGPVGG